MNNQLFQYLQFFLQQKLRVPADIVGDPNKILNYLLQTQKVSQQQVNQAYEMAQRYLH